MCASRRTAGGCELRRRATSGTPTFLKSKMHGLHPQRRRAGRAGEQRVVGGRPGRGWAVYWHGYESTWLPASLLQRESAERSGRPRSSPRRGTGRCRCTSTRGSRARPGGDRRRAGHRDEPGGARRVRAGDHRRRGSPAYPGVPGREPTTTEARRGGPADRSRDARAPEARARPGFVRLGEQLLREGLAARVLGRRTTPGCSRVKKKYDPTGLFFVHHGVGSEEWSPDGMTRLRS